VEGNVTGNLTGSVASVSGNVGGNVTGSVGSVSGTTFPASFPANITAMQIDANGVVTAGGTFRKNTASQVFPIYLVNAAGVAVTGSTVSVTVSKDGAAFGAITGSVVETGSGWYDVNLSQADTNCTNCKYVATGTGGATARPFFFRTAP